MEITHYLPIKPISVNECWQGRRYKTKKYDAFIEEMLYTMPKEKCIEGFVEIEIILGLKSVLRSDVDNFLKPIVDCIVKKKWIHDDRYVMKLVVHKIKQANESISIIIREIKI